MNHSQKWFYVTFDPAWVRCRNHKCNQLFPVGEILGKRKCPRCRMDNKLCITPTAAAKPEDAARGYRDDDVSTDELIGGNS